MINNNAPENGDFAAYLENLNKPGKTALPVLQDPPIEEANLEQLQELTELPPISDDELLKQALATEGNSNEYDLDELENDAANEEVVTSRPDAQNAPATGQAVLAFLGEHALELADQAPPEDIDELPLLTDEELTQQALAHPDADKN
ncbi:hypothetical protein ACO0LC_04475 [Undibacterium sp. JH2W]|uniref:hypothetical protein n=1 Tax=Undibacterium sp. JH2W TaxID=3413037 RepID=UPI003BF2B2B8